MAPRSGRTVFVHVGTHKTGSTALQYFLAQNEAALAAAGVYVPRTGRLAAHPEGCGHHNIALELTQSWRYHPPLGTLADLVAEVAACGYSRVCISSEEFQNLHDRPAYLQQLCDAFAAIGFSTSIIVYLRPQADYLEALYAEIAKGAWHLDFPTCLDAMLRHATITPGGVIFSYERLIDGFAAVVGRDRIVVRPFKRDERLDRIQREFATMLGLSPEQMRSCTFGTTDRVNGRLSFAGTMMALHAASRGKAYEPGVDVLPARWAHTVAKIDGPFDPLQPREILRIVRRFGGQNARLSWRYRAIFGCVSWSRLRRMFQARMFGDGDQAERRRVLDIVIADRRAATESHRSETVMADRTTAL